MKYKQRQEIEAKFGRPAEDVMLDLLNNFDVATACEQLGVSTATFYYWAKGLNLERRWVKR